MIQWPKQRAWGWYATLLRTPWFCIKLLKFKPHSSLSMQRHNYRTEIWWFLGAFGKIRICPYISDMMPKRFQCIWVAQYWGLWKIRQGWWHKFTSFRAPVYVIELQYGKKVTELDIERNDGL